MGNPPMAVLRGRSASPGALMKRLRKEHGMTLAELARSELPQGTALFNFFRQLGGSLGIAGVATIV